MSQTNNISPATHGVAGDVTQAEALGPSAVVEAPATLAGVLTTDFNRDLLAKPTRRVFTKEQIQEILAAVDDAPRGQAGAVLRSYGVYSGQVHQWRLKYSDGTVAKNKNKSSDQMTMEQQKRRIAELEEENRELGLIIDALKKVTALAKDRASASRKDTGK